MTEDIKDVKPVEPKAPELDDSDSIYIVNPLGTVHTVSKALARTLLAKVGYRKATAAEKKAYKSNDTQSYRSPIAKPHAQIIAEMDVE